MQTNTRRRQLLAAAAALGGAGLVSAQQQAADTEAAPDPASEPLPARGIEGRIAPELQVRYWIDKNGEPSSFSVLEARGKWVFLKCFQNWCPGCHSSGFPTLKAFADRFADHPDVAIAGIQTVFEGYRSNTVDDVRKLQLRYELPIVMGHEPGNREAHTLPATMVNYRTGGTPWLVLIAPDGRVVFNDFHVNSDKLIDYIAKQVA